MQGARPSKHKSNDNHDRDNTNEDRKRRRKGKAVPRTAQIIDLVQDTPSLDDSESVVMIPSITVDIASENASSSSTPVEQPAANLSSQLQPPTMSITPNIVSSVSAPPSSSSLPPAAPSSPSPEESQLGQPPSVVSVPPPKCTYTRIFITLKC